MMGLVSAREGPPADPRGGGRSWAICMDRSARVVARAVEPSDPAPAARRPRAASNGSPRRASTRHDLLCRDAAASVHISTQVTARLWSGSTSPRHVRRSRRGSAGRWRRLGQAPAVSASCARPPTGAPSAVRPHVRKRPRGLRMAPWASFALRASTGVPPGARRRPMASSGFVRPAIPVRREGLRGAVNLGVTHV
jgi:hypothetical protein